jgi:16S rRNA (uracil1498-N3)-methyltransferase
MRRLFVPPGSLEQPYLRIAGAEFHHLAQVLRLRPGDELMLLDGQGRARFAVIESLDRREIHARIGGPAPAPPDPVIQVTVAQAIGKGDRFEDVIQHCTEAGAVAFIPLLTSRTVVRLDPQSAAHKIERWTAIARGAAEQAGRERIPEISPPLSLAEGCARFESYSLVLLLDPGGDPLPGVLAGRRVMEQSPCLLLVGPEGGFSLEEVESARKAGAQVVSLGPYVFRTETAAVAALSQLSFWSCGEL